MNYKTYFYIFIILIFILVTALIIFLYYNWNIFYTVFSNVWVILPKNLQIVLECFDWIARWTFFVYKLQEFVTFAFVWAELTEIISRGKTDFTESPTADLVTNARVSWWSSFYKFFVDVRAENLVGSPEVTGPREKRVLKSKYGSDIHVDKSFARQLIRTPGWVFFFRHDQTF